MEKNNGITLIALIITIVVMLILVAVTVSILVESDLIGSAEKTGNAYKSAQAQEQTMSQITIGNKTYASINDYMNKNPITGEEEEDPPTEPTVGYNLIIESTLMTSDTGVCSYSTDLGETWVVIPSDIPPYTINLSGVTQIRFKTSGYIGDSIERLNVGTSMMGTDVASITFNGDEQISEDYILESDTTIYLSQITDKTPPSILPEDPTVGYNLTLTGGLYSSGVGVGYYSVDSGETWIMLPLQEFELNLTGVTHIKFKTDYGTDEDDNWIPDFNQLCVGTSEGANDVAYLECTFDGEVSDDYTISSDTTLYITSYTGKVPPEIVPAE